ncbi:MAG: prepilin-type N-terminal cleavage/methylation domain-containing protein [bacterium]
MQKRQGFTLLELLIVVVILGVLALIAAPSLLNAADQAKEGTVKANISAAASSVTSRIALDLSTTNTTADIADAIVTDLNAENKNPFDTTAVAFATSGTTAGSVVISATDADTITITGYGKTGNLLLTKTINAPESN